VGVSITSVSQPWVGNCADFRIAASARKAATQVAPGAAGRGSRVQDRGDVAGAVLAMQDHDGDDQRRVTGPRDDPFLARRALGGHPLGVEQEELVQKHARRDPGQRQLQRVARDHQQHHGGERRAEPAGETALPRLAIHVGRREAQHDPADECHQHQHHRADRVEPGGEAEAADADEQAGGRTVQDQQERGEKRDAQRAERDHLGDAQGPGRAELRPPEGEDGGGDQRDRREEGQDGDRHGRVSPWGLGWLAAELAGRIVTKKFIVCGFSFSSKERNGEDASVPLMRVPGAGGVFGGGGEW
jgi:hypothetical protein